MLNKYLLVLILLFAGCSPSITAPPVNVGAILSRYQRYEDKITTNLIARVEDRITSAPNTKNPEIILLDTTDPIAAAVNERTLLLSTGMLIRLQSESEFAFLLAHEISHIILNHSFTLRDSERIPNEELAADAKALEIVTAAGYEPKQAIGLIMREARDKPGSRYPERVSRLHSLLITWAKSPLPGVSSTRDFDSVIFRLKRRA